MTSKETQEKAPLDKKYFSRTAVEFDCDVTEPQGSVFFARDLIGVVYIFSRFDFDMICAKLYILLTLVISFSFAEDVYECPLQCDCSDDYSVVTCRGMEKFPALDFAAKVKIL